MVSNASETILQLDNQEQQQQQQQQSEAEQGDQQRGRLTGAMRKFSAIARHTNPRIDSNRKPFFAAIKTPKIWLQPWPSATNLSRINRHRGPDTPAPFNAPKILCVPSALQISFSDETEDQENREGFDNSAFFHEDVDDRYIEDQDDDTIEKLRNVNRFKRFVLTDTSECSDAQIEAIDLPRFRETIEQKSESFFKYLPQRQRSSTESSDKKGVHWRIDERRPSLLARRKTIHSVPTSLQIVIPQARSSPNLTNIEVEEKQMEKLDTPDESEKDTKL